MVKSFLKRLFGNFGFAEGGQVESTQTKETMNLVTYGTSGTEIYGGYFSEDYLYKMRGHQRAELFDQMRRSDPNIEMNLSAVKNPILDALWEVIPGDDSPEAQKDADLIRHILFNDMMSEWSKFLGEALNKIEFGHSIFEVTHKVVSQHPEFGSYIGLKNLYWRNPKTIERWNISRETEELVSVTQQAYGDLGKTVDIPAKWLLVFNVKQEGSNYEGISILRPCYGNYFRKNTYLKLNAAGIEKFAIPTPTAEIPDGKQGGEQFENLVEALEKFTSHQKQYLTYPAGWKVELVPNSGYDPSKVETSIDNEDRRMTCAFLANFLSLGQGSTGSFALSNDLSDFFLSALVHLADEIAGKINKQLIPDLIKLNRGDRKVYPKLKQSGINDRAGVELANILSSLSNSKVIIPDNPLEDHIRNRYGLPVRSEEGQRVQGPPPEFTEPTLSEKIKSRVFKGIKWRNQR